MMRLGAIGPTSAWLLVMEFFGWRRFRNRRVRAMIVENAWLWLRFQPKSALSQWYQSRFAGGGLRMRRIGIVALARRLLIALWRTLEDGVIPEGARLITSEI